MPKLILIKHAPPQIDPAVPSPRWVLSEGGRERCVWLAEELQTLGIRRLFASLEPKALETAALAAVRIGLAIEPQTGLNENDRTGFAFVTEDELRTQIGQFFDRPSDLVIGNETANTAYGRFESAVRGAVEEAKGQDLAIVTHGTVLTLLVSRHNAVVPIDFWGSLGLPAYVVLDAASFVLEGIVHNFPVAR